MTLFDYSHILTDIVDKLSDNNSYRGLFHQHKDGEPLPSGKALEEIIDLSRAILFPGYFGKSNINSQNINYRTDSGRSVLRSGEQRYGNKRRTLPRYGCPYCI